MGALTSLIFGAGLDYTKNIYWQFFRRITKAFQVLWMKIRVSGSSFTLGYHTDTSKPKGIRSDSSGT